MRPALRALGVTAVLGAAACAAVATTIPRPAGIERSIRVEANRTPLGIGGATLAPGVRYAGGLTLRGPDLHGLSDIKIQGDVAWVVSDFGHLIRFVLGLEGQSARLVSVDHAARRDLSDADGIGLSAGANADAEGLAILADGRVRISFERDHRIWSYGVEADARPVAVASPTVDLPSNGGFEGLSAAGGDGWLVLAEGGGAWVCASACTTLGTDPLIPADGYSFTGADRDPAGDGWFVVERLYRPPLTLRVRVRRLSAQGILSAPLIELRPPASVDNFEGIAAVEMPMRTRLYLLSDDNANPLQKTLLLAFDVPRT